MAAARYEPGPSYAPCYSVVNGKLYMWGGKVTAAASLNVYNPLLESWRKLIVRGSKPSSRHGGASANSGHYLYVYGGFEKNGSFNGDLHRLDMLDKSGFPTWTKLEPPGEAKSAERRSDDKSEHRSAAKSECRSEDKLECRSKDISERRSEDISERRSEDISDRRSEDISECHREDISERRSEDISERHCEDISERHSEAISERHSEDKSKRRSEDISERHSEDISERHSEDKSERRSEDISERHSEDISKRHSEDISERRSEDKSGRCSEDGPMKKAKCGMIVHENAVILIGGYGVRNNLHRSNFKWVKEKAGDADEDLNARGYTNEIHMYKEKKWSPVNCTGAELPPCSDFSLTMIDFHRAVLFGGIQKVDDGGNETFILDLLSMRLSKLPTQDVNSVMMRDSHTAVCLDYCGDQPHLLIVGGRTAHAVLNDAWLLHVESGRLESISLPQFRPRHNHCSVAIRVSPEISEVVIFGGSEATGAVRVNSVLADTNVLRFQKNILDSQAKWCLTDLANKLQLGIAKRIREKLTKLSLSANEIHWHMRELRKCQLEAERRIFDLQNKVDDLEKEKKYFKEQELSWIVQREEILLSNESIGSGAWGEVKEAEFRGQKVAAKILHKKIDYPQYRELIKREMRIASLVRCPNLVQFIAANMDKEMIILMELLHTSLRKLLDGPIPETEAFRVSICLDIAKALNYLHLMKPNSIIHRDISSSNVLLEPLGNQQWRAKVSDYGSANIKDETKTENPGAPAYSAPESNEPNCHTPKMDIFSYGVLLIEIFTTRLPLPDVRNSLMLTIKESHWVDLIQECLKKEKTQRPTACQIISKLKSWENPK